MDIQRRQASLPQGLTMAQTINLPDDLADALADEASRLGMSLPDYAVRLLASTHPSPTSVHSGAELVAFWRAEGLVGCRPDLADSQTQARQLREQAQRRRA
jgi:hypothetical protein